MNNFDLKKYLVENKLTGNAKQLAEVDAVAAILGLVEKKEWSKMKEMKANPKLAQGVLKKMDPKVTEKLAKHGQFLGEGNKSSFLQELAFQAADSVKEVFYGSSDGDFEADQESKQLAYYNYDKGLEAYREGDKVKAQEFYTLAMKHGSTLGWSKTELPPYETLNEEDSMGKVGSSYPSPNPAKLTSNIDKYAKDIVETYYQGQTVKDIQKAIKNEGLKGSALVDWIAEDMEIVEQEFGDGSILSWMHHKKWMSESDKVKSAAMKKAAKMIVAKLASRAESMDEGYDVLFTYTSYDDYS